MLNRRTVVRAVVGAMASLSMGLAFAGQVVHVVVPFPPGGGGDTLARSVTDKFEAALGKTVVVDNRPGAGGTVGTSQVARAKPDGQTIGYVTNGIMCVNRHLYPMTFDPNTDLVPIARLSEIGLVVALNPNVIPGVTDLNSLIKYAKEHPGAVDFASSGPGTTSHLAGLLFEKEAGVKLNHIPHKGGAPAMMNVLGGRIPLMIDVSPNVLKHLDGGKIKALAVTSAERLKAAPNLPTMKELGYPGMVLTAWDGFVAPKGMSKELVAQYNAAIQTALKDPEVIKRLQVKAAEGKLSTPEQFAEFIAQENPKWKTLAEAIGIQTK